MCQRSTKSRTQTRRRQKASGSEKNQASGVGSGIYDVLLQKERVNDGALRDRVHVTNASRNMCRQAECMNMSQVLVRSQFMLCRSQAKSAHVTRPCIKFCFCNYTISINPVKLFPCFGRMRMRNIGGWVGDRPGHLNVSHDIMVISLYGIHHHPRCILIRKEDGWDKLIGHAGKDPDANNKSNACELSVCKERSASFA